MDLLRDDPEMTARDAKIFKFQDGTSFILEMIYGENACKS